MESLYFRLTQLSGIKVIGLPSEHCEILMGQPDHLDTGATAEGQDILGTDQTLYNASKGRGGKQSVTAPSLLLL